MTVGLVQTKQRPSPQKTHSALLGEGGGAYEQFGVSLTQHALR